VVRRAERAPGSWHTSAAVIPTHGPIRRLAPATPGLGPTSDERIVAAQRAGRLVGADA
jgi:hypothetical protein